MVTARNSFLSLGYYSHLKETLENLADKYSGKTVSVLDCGCGEGYYTQGVCQKLVQQRKQAEIKGIDKSKEAVSIVGTYGSTDYAYY